MISEFYLQTMKSIDLNPEIINFAKEYAKKPKNFLLLSGRTGTGKSLTAMSIYDCVSPYKLPAYDSDVAIFSRQSDLNRNFSNSDPDEKDCLFEKLAKTKLLVIDDLGTRVPSDSFMDFLYALADERYIHREKVGTIITTNLTSTQMRDQFGDAFVSRVASGKCFRLEGIDHRFAHKTQLDSIGADKMAMASLPYA